MNVLAANPESIDIELRRRACLAVCWNLVGSNLYNYLKRKHIQFLFLSCIATNISLESTGRDAFFCECWPRLVEDAVNHAGPDCFGETTKWNFENNVGRVTDIDSVLANLSAS